MSKRFRWTRKTYMKARALARLMRRLEPLPDCPDLLRRYFELWARHEQHDDPLLTHIQTRLAWHSGIPF